MSAQIQVTMSGQMPTPPYQVVTWTVWNMPDNTGAQSGYGANFLQNVGVTALAVSGAAVNPLTLTVGGDLSGSLPNPSVSGLQGVPLGFTPAPTVGEYLQYNGTHWTSAAPRGIYFVSFKVEAGSCNPWNTNWVGAGVTIVYNAVGNYTLTVPGSTISDSGAWTNLTSASATANGFVTSANPEAPTQPTKVIVTCWDSLDALASDPNDPDCIITVFWIF